MKEKSPSEFDIISPDEVMQRYPTAFGSKSTLYRIMRNDPDFPAVKPEGSRKWIVFAIKLPDWFLARMEVKQSSCYNNKSTAKRR